MFLDNSIFPKTHGNNCKLKFLGWPKDSNNQSTVPAISKIKSVSIQGKIFTIIPDWNSTYRCDLLLGNYDKFEF